MAAPIVEEGRPTVKNLVWGTLYGLVMRAISVILPTAATATRLKSLNRAIDSVLSQQDVKVELIVVANGPQCDDDILNGLAARSDIRLVYTEEGSYPAALRVGRDLVGAPFFAEIDDDDEFLPMALATRLHHIELDPSIDVVVTNGILCRDGQETIGIRDIDSCQTDPLRRLMDDMWLVPCAALYRTETVTPDFFATIPPAMEWTYVGTLLSLKKKIVFVDVPTFVYNRDTTDSLSRSKGYLLSTPDAIERLMQLELPSEIRELVREKHVRSLHAASNLELVDGNVSEAWKWHLRTLTHPYGWRYLTYTRHLVK